VDMSLESKILPEYQAVEGWGPRDRHATSTRVPKGRSTSVVGGGAARGGSGEGAGAGAFSKNVCVATSCNATADGAAADEHELVERKLWLAAPGIAQRRSCRWSGRAATMRKRGRHGRTGSRRNRRVGEVTALHGRCVGGARAQHSGRCLCHRIRSLHDA